MGKTLYVYRASAGSGKTFTLAVEYIKLLVAHPSAYRHTLAVTFTNKATAEMKERILSQLYGIAHSLPASNGYYNKIAEAFPSMDEDTLRQRAREALQMILHDYGHFRIQTIDAFFQSILRGLARELELSGDMEITIDSDALLEETVDMLIRRLTPTSENMGHIVEYIEEHLDNDKDWNVRRAIKEFAGNILKEEYQERGDNLRRQIDADNGALLREFRKAVRGVEHGIVESVKNLAARFFEIADANGVVVDDFSYKNSGVWGFFDKMKQGELLKPGNRIEGFMTNPVKISKKLPQNVCEDIAALLREAERMYTQEYRRLVSCRLSLARFHQLRLLNSIADTLREENRRENRFLLAQTTYLLSRMIDNDTSFIFEKIGTEINHIFIDEFQDTSKLQWSCFKVLMSEVMSRGGLNLIVGDVKQSIYRWRNSDWNILNNIWGEFPQGTTGDYLKERMDVGIGTGSTTNYRSLHNVVRFNNELFTRATEVITATYGDRLGNRLDDLTRAYGDVVQQLSPRKENGGYAEIRLIGKGDEGFTAEVHKRLIDTLRMLLEEKGVRPSDITILVRTRSAIVSIVKEFNTHLPAYSIVSDDAYKLSSSSALRIIIAAMRYVAQPDNKLNMAELILAYTSEVLHKEIPVMELGAPVHKLKELLPQSFVAREKELPERPIYELIEEIIACFGLGEIAGESAFIYSFLDYTSQYLETNSCNINDFLQAWDSELCEKSIPAAEDDSVHITTIHKSKGLEFHTVIVPFCNWKIAGDTRNILWCNPAEEPFNKLDLLPINCSSAMLDSIYAEVYNHEYLFQLVDNLNLMYVAFTRATHNLFVFSEADSKSNMAGRLLETIMPQMCLDNASYDSEEKLFTYGAIAAAEYDSVSKQTDDGRIGECDNPFIKEPHKLIQPFVTYENRLTSRQSNNLTRFLAQNDEELQNTEYMDIGELLHDVMAHLITGEELQQELDRLQMEGLIATEQDKERIRRLISGALANPVAQEWFSGRYTVYNECNILYRDGRQKVCRPDRVMILDGTATVVDFKFAKERKSHIQQVQEYMNNLTLMGYKKVRGFLWYVYKNRIVEIK